MISPLTPEATAVLHQRLLAHPQFRTYSIAFSWAFELPLFLSCGSEVHVSGADRRIPFCMMAEPAAGFCGRCPLRKFPALQKLEPWVWSIRCDGGLDVTVAPVRSGSLSYAWLVTGHHAVGKAGAGGDLEEQLAKAGFPAREHAAMREAHSKVPAVSRDRQDLLNHFLELMGAMLGSEVNAILTMVSATDSRRTAELKRSLSARRSFSAGNFEPDLMDAFSRESGMSPAEYLERVKIEDARREILAGNGSEQEIKEAARRAGCWDYSHFRRLFDLFFGESPVEHFQRMRRVQDDPWNGRRKK
jgi:hypothetical protein